MHMVIYSFDTMFLPPTEHIEQAIFDFHSFIALPLTTLLAIKVDREGA